MKIDNIRIVKIVPKGDGHLGFASCVIDGWLLLNCMGIWSRKDRPGEIRLVFPERKGGKRNYSVFHPLDSQNYFNLEKAILDKLNSII